MIKITAILSVLVFLTACERPQEEVRVERALSANRLQFEANLKQDLLRDSGLPWEPENSDRWQGMLWAAELLQFRHDSLRMALEKGLGRIDELDQGWQRALLEAVFGLFPGIYIEELSDFTGRTVNPKLFAMSVNYLTAGGEAEQRDKYFALLQSRFPDWTGDPILFMLGSSLSGARYERPPLEILLAHKFAPDLPVIFSLQRKDRRYPGLVILRDRNGRFLHDDQGLLLAIPQLAMAVSDLPGYLTNGNTPQGFFSIKGTEVSENAFIGPTTNLQLRMPFEVEPAEFFAFENLPDTAWQLESYQRLLPAAWQDYLPVYESFYAGMAGRTEIIAHGTTIDPEYYRDLPCYPFTPSLGCLTTLELWSGADGRRYYSDQVRLIRAWEQLGRVDGLYLVINLDDRKQPVTVPDIIQIVHAAEKLTQETMDKQ